MEGSELGDLECGSVQVKNNLARSARSSYRFSNLSLEGYREAFQAALSSTFFPGAVPWAVIVLHPRRAKTLNLTCRLPSGCRPLRSNPIFVFFGVILPDFLTTKATKSTKIGLGGMLGPDSSELISRDQR